MAPSADAALLPASAWPSKTFPRPPIEHVLNQLSEFFKQIGYDKTVKALTKEAQSNDITIDSSSLATQDGPLKLSLGDIYLDAFMNWPEELESEDKMDIGEESESSSEEESDSDSSESSSDSDDADSSDDDSETAVAPQPASTSTKRKREASESESESSSEEESSSDEEEEEPATKKPKIQEANSDADSDSSDSDDEAESSSDEASTKDDTSDSDSSEDETSKEATSASEATSDSDSSSDSSSDDSDSSSDDEPTPKAKASKAIDNASDSSSKSSVTLAGSDNGGMHPSRANRMAPTTAGSEANVKKKVEPFSRIPKDQAVDPRFSSNAYVSYDYADRAHQDLIVTRGKGFTKEKNKKKRGSYRGGMIDTAPKGIQFDD